MRGTRRAVIALVWLLGTGAATAITIEGVRVVGSNVINEESAISPRQANAALSSRSTTTSESATTVAVTTTVTTEAPTTTTTTTEVPTTVAVTEAATTPSTARRGPTTTRKKPVATSPPTAKPPTTPPPTSPPTVTTPAPPPPTTPPTTPPPTTTIKPAPTTTASPQCTQQTRQRRGNIVTACFTSQKVTVLGAAPSDGWTVQQSAFGSTAVVKFTKGSETITFLAYWSGGPQWQITDSGG